MIIRTRIFELCDGRYKNLSELARAMGISVSQIYRVREGQRKINQIFIIGAIKAFPEYSLDDLFYFVPGVSISDYGHQGSTEEKATKATRREESAEKALEEFTSAVGGYARHLKSHTSALISLNEASQELKNTTAEANRILCTLSLKSEKNESK